jgi:pimeloyl-ACP methyl ester carboxylesterase
MQMITGYREHTIEARGLRFHYLEWGDPASPPMVLLHGRPQMKKLAESGHGAYQDLNSAVAEARAGNPTAPDENLRHRTEWNLNTAGDGTMKLKYDHRVQAGWQPADLTDSLPQLRMPVLLVRGGLTTVLPRSAADAMLLAIPDAEMVQVDDSGHSVPTDRPEKLTPLVLDWLARRA